MTAVALLAPPGAVRERLVNALLQIGMDLVLEADLSEADDDQIQASGARALIVVLDADNEDLLERFDRSLDNPNITVLLEEAEMVVARNGWDAARWSRHIAAKLGGLGPAVPAGSPASTAPEPVAPAPGNEHDHATRTGSGAGAGADLLPFPVSGRPERARPAAIQAGPAESPPTPLPAREGSGLKLVDNRDSDELQHHPGDSQASAPVALEPGATRLSLVDRDDIGGDGPDSTSVEVGSTEAAGPGASDGPGMGAVMIEGGLGAPDALRRLLGGIPEGFPLAVLVRIMLEGGRYDSLVKQMKRVATLPMKVARAGDVLQPGTIYFLSPTISAEQRDATTLAFVEADPARTTDGLHATLLAGDSALLLLSGADTDLVEPAVAYAEQGAWVAAQAPETCYDATVPNALILRGAQAAPAADLVAHLIERWPARRAQA